MKILKFNRTKPLVIGVEGHTFYCEWYFNELVSSHRKIKFSRSLKVDLDKLFSGVFNEVLSIGCA